MHFYLLRKHALHDLDPGSRGKPLPALSVPSPLHLIPVSIFLQVAFASSTELI